MDGTGRASAPTFARQVKEHSGVNFAACYQCLTCTLGCPALSAMDYLPHQIIRMVQTGDRHAVLESSTIWACASCETCVTRCPREIDLPHLMDTLRQMALQAKVKGRETGIPAFHRTFLRGIRQWGRQYELGMMLEFKWKTRDWFSDIGLGVRMLQKGKLDLLPKRLKGHREVKGLWPKSEGMD